MKNYFNIALRSWKILKPFHKDFYFQLFIISLSQGLSITFTLIVGKLIDALIGKDMKMVFYILIAYPLLRITDGIVTYIGDMSYQRNIFGQLTQHIQEFSLKKILTLNISQYTEDHSAIKKDITDRGEEAVRGITENIILQITPIFVYTIFALGIISWYVPIIGMWCIATIIVLILWLTHFQKYFRPFMKKDRDNWIEQRKVKLEGFQHLQLIRQTGVEEFFLKKFLHKRMEIVKYSIFTWNKNVRHYHLRDIYIKLGQYGALILAVYFFSKGSITVGAIYAIFYWSGDLYGNLTRLAMYFRTVPTQVLDIEKYFESAIDKKPVFKESGKEKFKHGDIIFENISFKYPKGEQNILENISFVIPENKKVAFVGHSGSGKSTVIKLFLRAYDYDSGSIKIGSKELRDLNAIDLRRNIGYVEQHVDLLDDTLKENILFGVTKNKKITDKELEQIAKRTRIDQFYNRLGDKKFETFVGERGVKLSGGERQRVGIARAIVKNPNILIFDEATSSLDTENEAKVMEAIDDVSKGKTTIIVAHRLSTIKNADIIIVMDKGRVVGTGSHDELIENCPEYKNLVEHQME